MGMFNYLTFKDPPDLPGINEYPDDPEWQTKSIEPNSMECLRVTEDGRLEREIVEYGTVPKEDRPYPDSDEDSFKALFGSVSRDRQGWRDLNYHGVVSFIGEIGNEWRSFEAKFTDGELVEIQPDDSKQSTDEGDRDV